ncbi:MAG: hypothetical protein V3U26_04685 [Dehalococcoidia bacterium]
MNEPNKRNPTSEVVVKEHYALRVNGQDYEMPATPERVYYAIREAKARGEPAG